MVSGASDDEILGDAMARVVSVAIVVTIAAVVLSLFLGAVADTGTGGAATASTQDDLLVSGGDVTLSGDNVSDPTVKQSLNDSAQLDGASAITGELGADVAADRTVSTWARVDNTSGVRQVVSVDSRTILVYNGTSSEWSCWSYDDSSGQTHRAAVSAASPGVFTNLQCERAGGALTLRVNDSTTASVQTDSANATAQTLQTTPLDGSVDETRVFNGTLTSSEQSALYNTPTAPLESAPRQGRIMYDAYGSLDSIPVYIAGGTLDGTAATKAAGLEGQTAVEGTDWSLSGDVIDVLAGGVLEGAPVVFVAWSFGSGGVGLVPLGALSGPIGAALRLAALVPLALVAQKLLRIKFA
jgi:hypothetical protein